MFSMTGMFTIDQIFDQLFPALSGISWDLGTLLTALMFLWIIAEGATLLWEMMDSRIQGHFHRKDADYYLEQAEYARFTRDELIRDTALWDVEDLVYKKYIRKSADSYVKGWR